MLMINIPGGGQLPATLKINQSGDSFTGVLESEMGSGSFDQVIIDGESFGALLVFEMQGQTVEGKVSGDIEDQEISGTIELSIPLAPPLIFSGTRHSLRRVSLHQGHTFGELSGELTNSDTQAPRLQCHDVHDPLR
ncbi:MAG: hypothetical protein WKF84_04305 [Pyrinomonadaceae bacterium]